MVCAVTDLGEPLMRREGVETAAVARVDVSENIDEYEVQHGLGPSQMWDAV